MTDLPNFAFSLDKHMFRTSLTAAASCFSVIFKN